VQRPERVWPVDSTRLERIAFRAGLDADEVHSGCVPRSTEDLARAVAALS